VFGIAAFFPAGSETLPAVQCFAALGVKLGPQQAKACAVFLARAVLRAGRALKQQLGGRYAAEQHAG